MEGESPPEQSFSSTSPSRLLLLVQRSKSLPCSGTSNMGKLASSPDSSSRRRQSARHHQSGQLLKRDPAQQQQLQMRSLAGILLLVVSLSTFSVTSTFQSVLLTDTTSIVRQRQLEDRHPLSGRRRKLRNYYQQLVSTTRSSTNSTGEQQQSSQQDWYVLSFGSASTWGSGLVTSQQAYPSLLGDPEALSVALPTGHVYADLAAACAQTMVVGAEDSDTEATTTSSSDINLITVEYYEFSESHRVLIQRLRRRYPAAAIVLVRLLQPATQLVLTKDAESTLTRTTFAKWKAQREERDPSSSDDTLEEVLLRLVQGMVQAGGTWGLAPATAVTDSRITAMLHSDSLLLHQQLPVPFEFRAAQDLHDVLRLYNFQGDATVLSAAGHAAVAEAIQSLVRATVPSTLLHNLRSNAVAGGNWGSGDDCHVWYATGNYNLESTGRRVNLPIIQQHHHHQREDDTTMLSLAASSAGMIAGTHKHALEFDRRTTPASTGATATATVTAIFGSSTGTNKITVHNLFDHDRMLSLTYLTDADSMSYPRTRVVVNGAPTVLLQPFHDHVTTNTRQVARTSGVGFIPPGTSVVTLEPLQSTKLPFRLLGASLLAEEVQNLPTIEFTLEPDSLEAEADDDIVVVVEDESPVVSTASAISSGSGNNAPHTTASAGLLSILLLR